MSGAIMNKVLDLFGMDNTEEEVDYAASMLEVAINNLNFPHL